MAGLLDGLVGDDTVKDEYGQTQADRRDPIWSGLIRAGLLAVAGGGKLMPEQRAQYIAQAGGALADIPKDMQNAAAASAQQKLRGQQLDEGKRKVADRDRIRQMMQAPEIADIVNKATGADKIAIQAAVQTGDIGALNTAIGNLDKAGINAEKLSNAAEKMKWEREKFAELQAQKGGWGNTFEGQARTILAKGRTDPEFLKDPKNQVLYAQAHEYLSTERPVTIGNQTMILPKMRDIDDYPKPGAPPAPTSPTVTDPQPQVPQGPPVVKDNPDGSKSWPNPAKPTETMTEYPDGTVKVTGADGKEIRTEAPQKADPHTLQELTKIQAAEAKIQVAGKDFINQWKTAPQSDRMRAIAGLPSDIMSSWTQLAALIKESAVLNLGVLNGGDKAFIEGALANPGKILSQWGDPAVVERQVQRIFNILDAGKKVYEDRVSKPPSRAPKTTAATPPVRTWNPATGKIE